MGLISPSQCLLLSLLVLVAGTDALRRSPTLTRLRSPLVLSAQPTLPQESTLPQALLACGNPAAPTPALTPQPFLEPSAAEQDAAAVSAARTLRIESIAFINALVIGSFAFAIAYEILHVDLEAIVALYTYPSGEVSEGFSKAAASLDLLARLPMDQIRAYEALVPSNPIFYKACTSGFAYVLGDFISQVRGGLAASLFGVRLEKWVIRGHGFVRVICKPDHPA